MNKKCPNCNVVNFISAAKCVRCETALAAHAFTPPTQNVSGSEPHRSRGEKILWRAAICALVCVLTIAGFYLSLLLTSKSLTYEEKQSVRKAIGILDEKGFKSEVFMLRYLTSFRGNDNWLNASTRDENAYAATNFPFEIITIYPEFFTVPHDDTERAMILLHEARHLKGSDEKEAYEYVWRERKKLGWTRETHGGTRIFINIENQTREEAPELFRCGWMSTGDCTE